MPTLVIANKVYSSWSLRPWILMRELNLPFEEVLIPFGPTFDDPEWKAKVKRYSAAGKVPALVDDGITVWESLAIIEYLADKHPGAGIWPKDVAARAYARSISSEMHAGFQALRGACPMNVARRFPTKDRGPGVEADVARIAAIWREARERFGVPAGGPFLFGAFCAADAMFAPVAVRLRAYGITVDAVGEAYVDAVLNTTAYQAWREAALQEPWIVDEDEVDERPLQDFRKLD